MCDGNNFDEKMNSIAVMLVEAFDSSDSSESDSYSEETSDTEDEIELLLFLAKKTNRSKPTKKLKLKPEAYLNNVVSNLNSYEFKNNYRISPSTFEYILTLIGQSITRQTRGHKTISAKRQFLLTLWVMSSGESYKFICERFSTARATAIVSVRKVLVALNRLSKEFIRWPEDRAALDCMEGFESICGLKKIIGAIDNTHIYIQAPRTDAEIYVKATGGHSIQLQVVCDHTRRFIHCYAGHPGSVHDQQVLSSSEVNDFLDNPDTYFPQDSFLVGDEAYSISQHLMVPYKDSGYLTMKEKTFNSSIKCAHDVAKKALGLLKGRFPRLKNKIPMTRIDVIPSFIIAACVLHNICLIRRDNMPEFDNTTDVSEEHKCSLASGFNQFRAAGSDRRVQITSGLGLI